MLRPNPWLVIGGIVVLLLCGRVVAAQSTPLSGSGEASAVVQALHTALSTALHDADALGYEGRYETLAPAIGTAYDLPLMARRAVGRHFRKLDEEQRKQLLETFTALTVATYANRLSERSDSQFEILSEEPADHGTTLVKANVVDSDGEEIALTYRLRRVDGAYRIIDIFLKGTISELALRRSEYTSLLEREGFEGLLDTLNAKIESHRSTALADSSS